MSFVLIVHSGRTIDNDLERLNQAFQESAITTTSVPEEVIDNIITQVSSDSTLRLIILDSDIKVDSGELLFKWRDKLPWFGENNSPMFVFTISGKQKRSASEKWREITKKYAYSAGRFFLCDDLIDSDELRDLLINEANCRHEYAKKSFFIGEAPEALHMIQNIIAATSFNDVRVLILGETGTGKDVTARMIHEKSSRCEGPFVECDLAYTPKGSEDRLHAELFGYEKGAFTGAEAMKMGRFELACGGTIFLNEIGELPFELQSKLLRVIEHKTMQRMNSNQEINLDVRYIFATNRDLKAGVAQGNFRKDLYYRIAEGITIELPPLRMLGSGVERIFMYFIGEVVCKYGKTAPKLSNEAREALIKFDWPGNFRQAKTVAMRVYMTRKGMISLEDLTKEYEATCTFTEPNQTYSRLKSDTPLSSATSIGEILTESEVHRLSTLGKNPIDDVLIMELNPNKRWGTLEPTNEKHGIDHQIFIAKAMIMAQGRWKRAETFLARAGYRDRYSVSFLRDITGTAKTKKSEEYCSLIPDLRAWFLEANQKGWFGKKINLG